MNSFLDDCNRLFLCRAVLKFSRSHYITPTKTRHYERGNPSKLVYIDLSIKLDSSQFLTFCQRPISWSLLRSYNQSSHLFQPKHGTSAHPFTNFYPSWPPASLLIFWTSAWQGEVCFSCSIKCPSPSQNKQCFLLETCLLGSLYIYCIYIYMWYITQTRHMFFQGKITQLLDLNQVWFPHFQYGYSHYTCAEGILKKC